LKRKNFQPDFFSCAEPVWHPLNAELVRTLDELQENLPKALLPILESPLQSAAFGINSSNFKLFTSGGMLLLKRWPSHTDVTAVSKTLSLMSWLASNDIPAPTPLRFQHGDLLLKTNSGNWSVFPFFDADYFSGTDNQLQVAAKISGRLMSTLSRLPPSLMPEIGPNHLTEADSQILHRVEAARGQWRHIFGEGNAIVLEDYWDEVVAEWSRLTSNPPIAGPLQASHYDLHPHNLLFDGNNVAAVLDFEACKVMPVGYALGFAALKQCRQAIAAKAGGNDIRSVGSRYIGHLVDSNTNALNLADAISDLAICEVLRRINIIFRLNIESGNKAWNHVLPIQLGHISEAKLLFN